MKKKAKRDDDDEQSLGSLAWETVLSVVAPIAIGGISEMFGSIFKPNSEKEVIQNDIFFYNQSKFSFKIIIQNSG